ncbi:MAG: methyltransferase domain-containing protein [Chloroflexi bacterium]|nr:methyltransferase domain-containing protein [Chloroflexota bacterium]
MVENPRVRLTKTQAIAFKMVGRWSIGHESDKPHWIALVRWLANRGIATPWYPSASALQQHWSEWSNSAKKEGNRPEFYAQKPQDINRRISEIVSTYAPEMPSSVFEVGCNAGTNHEFWRQKSLTSIGATEINPNAIDQLRTSYPELAKQLALWEGPLEEMLPTVPDSDYDLVFSMAVLQHVHPASTEVMDQMSRIAGKLLLTCEREDVHTQSIVPRDYHYTFGRLGWKQLHTETLEGFSDPMYSLYTIRLLAKE